MSGLELCGIGSCESHVMSRYDFSNVAVIPAWTKMGNMLEVSRSCLLLVC